MAQPKFEIGQYVRIVISEDNDEDTREHIDELDIVATVESNTRYGWTYGLRNFDETFAESELTDAEANIEIIVENGVVKEVEFHNMKPIKWSVK